MTRHMPQHRDTLRQLLLSMYHWNRRHKIRALVIQTVALAAGSFAGLVTHHPAIESALVANGGVAIGTFTGVAIRVAARQAWADRRLARFSAFSVHGLTALAVLLAGRRRPALRAEWQAHLAGESGHDPVTWRKVKEALGFVASAIQCRCRDAADAAWTPADAILKSRKLSNMLVFGPTATAAMYILRHLGTIGVLTSAENISAIGGGLYGLVRVGRWWRDVKLPEPKARRASQEGDASP
jgi:hypothetical protein